MMQRAALLLASLLIAPALFAQTGRVLENLTMTSEILGQERHYAVYLPPDYETSEREYPVLYLLHGGGDDHTGWVQFGEVLHITDQAIRAGKATPMVIVMPDASGERRGYTNDIQGDWRYEDHFFEEFIPLVERTWRIRGAKRYRAVAGLSMGGHGSFMYAMHRPDLFASAAPLSAATGFLTLDDLRRRLGDQAASFDESVLQAYFERHSATSMAQWLSEESLNSVRWYIDCGDDDFLYEGNALVHIAFRKRNVRHEFRIRDGGHTWTYWRESLPEVLRFVSEGFHQY